MIASILPGVPMLMGKAAKEIYIILQKRVNREIVPIVETINTFEIAKKIQMEILRLHHLWLIIAHMMHICF
jgi:hypothetical protein